MEAGADVITRETFGSALIMGEAALKLLGYEDAQAYRIMRAFKHHDEAGLKKLYEVWGDDHAYGLRIHQSLENLEKVLQDDAQEEDAGFTEAWEYLQGAQDEDG